MFDSTGRVAETFEAKSFGAVTCMGHMSQPFPRDSGNCFDVVDADGKAWRIVNFVYENLVEALRRGVSDDRWAPGVAWPVACAPIGKNVAVITDPRIPTDWYQREWCEVCCPASVLPIPQRLTTALRRASGEETMQTVSGLTVVGSVAGQRIRLPGDAPPVVERRLSATWGGPFIPIQTTGVLLGPLAPDGEP